MWLAAGEYLGTFVDRIGDMLLDLGHGLGVDQWALLGTVFTGWGDLEGVYRGDQALAELLVHAVLHQKTVGAHAGLAAVAELRAQRALHGGIQVGVVENDKGRVAPSAVCRCRWSR